MKATFLTVVFLAAMGTIGFAATADEGAALFEARCTLCHQMPDPAMLNAGQWDAILSVMKKRIEQKGMPQLPDDEIKTIREFLHSHARQ